MICLYIQEIVIFENIHGGTSSLLKYCYEDITSLCSIISHCSCGIGHEVEYVVVLQTRKQTHVPKLKRISAILQNHSNNSGKDVGFHRGCHTIL